MNSMKNETEHFKKVFSPPVSKSVYWRLTTYARIGLIARSTATTLWGWIIYRRQVGK